MGVEPILLMELEPKSSVSAYSTKRACIYLWILLPQLLDITTSIVLLANNFNLIIKSLMWFNLTPNV